MLFSNRVRVRVSIDLESDWSVPQWLCTRICIFPVVIDTLPFTAVTADAVSLTFFAPEVVI